MQVAYNPQHGKPYKLPENSLPCFILQVSSELISLDSWLICPKISVHALPAYGRHAPQGRGGEQRSQQGRKFRV